jgi:very-short-patch-repair endonuclease
MDGPKRTKAFAKTLRRNPSPPEVILWQRLRGRRVAGLYFRRQHPIGPYVLDFYCDAAKLAVEVDGATHADAERARRDRERDTWCLGRGIETLRLSASVVLGNPADAARRIEAVATARLMKASGRRPARWREQA